MPENGREAALRALALCLGEQEYRSAMIGWAVDLLQGGQDGVAVTLLAGADFEDDRELLRLFRRAAAEQGIELPESEEELPWLERWLCEEIVAGRMEPGAGLPKLRALWRKSGWDRRFVRWCCLSEGVALLEEGIYGAIEPFEKMTLETFPEVMRAQAAEVLLGK